MWQKKPDIMARVVQDKYGFKKTYKDIKDMLLTEFGIDTSTRQIREVISGLGLPQKEREFYGNLDQDKVARYFKGLLQLPDFKVKIPKKKKSHRQKILLISDLHLPFVHEDLLAHIIKNEKDAHQLHINGDIFDFYSLSRFVPYRMDMNFLKEFNSAMQYLKIIAETWPTIEFSTGNHFTRLFKYILGRLGNKDLFEAGIIQYKPEQIITSNFPNMIKAEHKIKGTDLSVCFFNVVGDLLYGHFEKSSKIIGKPVRDAYDTMSSWRKAFEFDMRDIKVFVQAHTHKMVQFPYDGNHVMLMEGGCICNVQEYAVQPSMNYAPNVPGYITMIQEDGQTDWETIKMNIYR